MLKPKYIEQLPDHLIELYSELEQDILADMARRLSTYDYYIPAAQWQRNKLIELGGFEDWIIKALANRTDMTQEEIKALMEEAGMKALKFDDGIYKAAGLNVPPISASPTLLNVLNAGIIKTNGLFENLTNTTAGTATKQLENALDRAYMQIISGAFDKETSVRNAVKDLSRHGVGAITYPTGKTDSLETAVRRAVVTGVNQTALKLQEARAEQMDSDLVETTAHAGARPSHAEWQGKIFSLSGKSNKYPDFKSSTGYGTGAGLGGWNCRHSFYPYFEGSPRAYTDDELKEYNSKNVEYNGQKMTEYEASLQQRNIERNIRRWKRERKAMEAARLPTEEASAKIKSWQEREKNFLKQTGFKKQTGRSQIGGYGKRDTRLTTIESQKAVSISTKIKGKPVVSGEKGGIIRANRNMANGQRKSPKIRLTEANKEHLLDEIKAINADTDVFAFRDYVGTGYSDERDKIFISSNVFPSNDGSTHPRDLMSERAAIAHEYYGHRANRNSIIEPGLWNDEFRASYFAARDCPNLSDKDRRYLILDAVERANEAGISIRYNDFMRRIVYGY